MPLAHKPNPDDDLTEQMRNEILRVFDRYADESDVSIGQALAVCLVVQDDLMRLMKDGVPDEPDPDNL